MPANPDTSAVKRPILRYLGGKWAIAPWVIQHQPPCRIYVEPFGGAASVLLRRPQAPVEVYNDLDEEIVGLFRIVQDPIQCAALMRRLRRTPYARGAFERSFEPTNDPVIRAQRAVVRAYLSFHHGSLFDLRKHTFADAMHLHAGNPARSWASYARTLASIHLRLQSVVIERRDALRVIEVQDTPSTLFYVDPPYVPTARSSVGYRHELDLGKHVDLLERLLAVRGMVVLSGYPSDLYDQMLCGWRRIERQHHAAGSKRPRTEVLWISPRAAEALAGSL